MISYRLHPWLPEWIGAEQQLHHVDVAALRARAQELVDLVLTEDSVYLDALPEHIESSLITPLAILAKVLEDGSDVEVLVAARLVGRGAATWVAEAPDDLRRLLTSLPPAL